MNEQDVDILIVGGGLTGACLLLALSKIGYKTLLVDATPFSNRLTADFDARTLALAPASLRILQQLGVWALLAPHATAIQSIHVSEQGRFGKVLLKNDGKEALGFVVEMQHINWALKELVEDKSYLTPAQVTYLDTKAAMVTFKHGDNQRCVRAKLIVAADGTTSFMRQLAKYPVKIKNYAQQALVANVGLIRHHDNRAYERFSGKNILALLPMTNQRASLIWSLPDAEAKNYANMEESTFLNHLHQIFGYRLGRFNKLGKRVLYPLQQVIMPEQTAWPLVFVGNAAHTLHPIAAQGFNLGLRDVATLTQCIANDGINENMLIKYKSMRYYDQQATTFLTDGLITLFSSELKGLKITRHIGLLMMNHIPFLKNILTHHARGFSGKVPDLVCGIALPKREES